MKLKFTVDEYDLLLQVLEGPIGMFENHQEDYFLRKFGVSLFQVENMIQKIKKSSSKNEEINSWEIELTEEEVGELVKCYWAAELYLDPIELPIITGRSWGEAMQLESKLEGYADIK